ncbi:MAG: hypothetical protein ACLUNO_07910 [Oscillospiraceae bacterium]
MSPKKMIGLSFAAAAAKLYEVLVALQCAAQALGGSFLFSVRSVKGLTFPAFRGTLFLSV